LFSQDDRLHESLLEEGIAVDSPEARGPNGPDNWLVGRLWLNHGYDLVDSGVQIRRQTPLNFYETGPKWRLKFAEAIEKEGVLDDRAIDAWQRASQDWEDFGNRSIPTTARFTIKLGQLDELRRQREEKIAQLRELASETYDSMQSGAIKALPAYMRVAWEKSPDERNADEKALIPMITERIEPNLDQVAKSSDPSVRLKAVELVDEIKDLSERILKTDGYRNQINYPFWQSLAQAEQEERTVRARRMIYEAEKANADAELDKAIELYEQAFAIWAEVFDDYPILTLDDSATDLYESIRRYTIAIDSEELPEDFPLLTFVQLMGDDGQVDSAQYEQVRQEQKELLRKRKEELAEEERLREKELARENAGQKKADKDKRREVQSGKDQSGKVKSSKLDDAAPEIVDVPSDEIEKDEDETTF
jgi:hypothetical protein